MDYKLTAKLFAKKLAGSRDRKEPQLTPVALLSKSFIAAARKGGPMSRQAVLRGC